MSHYDVLGLPRPASSSGTSTPLSVKEVKEAYRRALLKHHPDKAVRKSAPSEPPVITSMAAAATTAYTTRSGTVPSIDDISLAYRTLSSPPLRAEYDHRLALTGNSPIDADGANGNGEAGGQFQTGLENVDLDDMIFDEEKELWYRGCRCGEERGYVVTEEQLGRGADEGEREVLVACAGCSLWLRVAFAVVDGEEDDMSNGREPLASEEAKPG